jgi:hypothetical protein
MGLNPEPTIGRVAELVLRWPSAKQVSLLQKVPIVSSFEDLSECDRYSFPKQGNI